MESSVYSVKMSIQKTIGMNTNMDSTIESHSMKH